MSQTLKVKCTCKSEYQDKLYGIGVRIATPTTKNPPIVRCTVCGKEHRV